MDENKVQKRKKTKLIVTAVVLSVVLVLAIFVACELNVSNLGIKSEGNKDKAYGYVLANIEGIKEANPRLVDISMLGSHDADTDKISMKSDTDEYASQGMKIVAGAGKGISYRFAKTQVLSVGEQLLQGSRYLHLKYSYTHGDWHGTHTLVGGVFSDYIKEIIEFCDTHPGEIIVIKFQPCSLPNSKKTYADFRNYLGEISYNGKTIYDFVNFADTDVYAEGTGGVLIGDLRYNDITVNGTKAGVVLIETRDKNDGYVPEMEGEDTPYKYKFFNLKSHVIDPWLERNSTKGLINGINATCEKVEGNAANYYKLRVIQSQACLAYKHVEDIFNDLFGQSLLRIAEKQNIKVIQDERINRWLNAMPILMVDFINTDNGDYNKKVNALMLERNKALVASILG